MGMGTFTLQAGRAPGGILIHLGGQEDFQLPLAGKTSSHFSAVNRGRRKARGGPPGRRFVRIAPIFMAII